MRMNVDHLSEEELRASREAWWSAEFDAFLWSAFPEVCPSRILDVGCGIGTLEQHFAPRLTARTKIIGIDIEMPRLYLAVRRNRDVTSGASESYVAGDGLCLPFHDGVFGVSVAVLTLQHVSEPTRLLAEMRRTTEPGGVVVVVEADNVGQRLYLPGASASLDRVVDAYWRRIQESCKPADIAVGPRLPYLFQRVGLLSPSVEGYLVAHATRLEAGAFAEQARARFMRVAQRYGVEESAECKALIETIEVLAGASPRPFYAISTVPLFMAFACV
jgi:ubiquinone/menaquinone biosynthesis C-methylase UbiE